MLNLFAKSILAATSLVPLLLIIAWKHHNDNSSVAYGFGIVGAILFLVCWAMMKWRSRHGEIIPSYIKEFNRRDQGTLTFVFIYLLPFIRSPESAFISDVPLTIALFFIIVVTMADVGAYNLNPVMRFFGYRFYEIRNEKGVQRLLITRKDLRQPEKKIRVRRISPDVYIQLEGKDASRF